MNSVFHYLNFNVPPEKVVQFKKYDKENGRGNKAVKNKEYFADLFEGTNFHSGSKSDTIVNLFPNLTIVCNQWSWFCFGRPPESPNWLVEFWTPPTKCLVCRAGWGLETCISNSEQTLRTVAVNNSCAEAGRHSELETSNRKEQHARFCVTKLL